MRKILIILSTVSLATSTSAAVISCGGDQEVKHSEHKLSRIFNTSVKKAVEENPVTKKDTGFYDTSQMVSFINNEIKNQVAVLRNFGIGIADFTYENASDHAFKSVKAFENMIDENDRDVRTQFLYDHKLRDLQLVIFPEEITATPNDDNRQEIIFTMLKVTVMDSNGVKFLLTDDRTITQKIKLVLM